MEQQHVEPEPAVVQHPGGLEEQEHHELRQRNPKALYLLVLCSSLVSLVASFILSRHAVELAAHPHSTFSCDVNSGISCTTVAESWQAKAFGFPNAFVGLMFEPVVCFFAVLGLWGVRVPRVLRLIMLGVYFLAVLFALWLFQQSVMVIHALCPYCLLVTLGTSLVFLNMVALALRDNLFSFGARGQERVAVALGSLVDVLLGVLYVMAILGIVLWKYGHYIL